MRRSRPGKTRIRNGDGQTRGTGTCAALAAVGIMLAPVFLRAEPVPVRHTEGVVHGFLSLRTLEGAPIADGDLIQSARGARVTSRLTFRFKDGSLHEETAVFSQRGHFRLITDHLTQKGPAFPRPIDMTIDTASGRVVVRYTDDDGKEQRDVEQLEMPSDLSNGLILTVLKNVSPQEHPKSLSFVAATPKPRLVKLEIASDGTERFSTGGTARDAERYVLKVDIGGLTGLLAPLVGKQPHDSRVWILSGEAPAFVRAEQPLYANGPVWRIELMSPQFSKASAQ